MGENDDDDVRRAYDQLAPAYAAHLPDTRAESPLELAVLDDFAASVAGSGPVLDAGCGAGRISRHLADRGCAVEGVDLSPGMVAAARRAHPHLRFEVASLTSLPHGAEHFAGVLLWYSTIHTPPEQLGHALGEAHRVLRPGGHLLIAFQEGTGTRDVGAVYRRLGHDVDLVRHLVPVEHAAAALRSLGLEEVCRLVRAPRGAEGEPQAVLLVRRPRAEQPDAREAHDHGRSGAGQVK